MRPVIKMPPYLALIVIGAALFFVILDDEDTGAASPDMPVAAGEAGAACPGTGTR